MRELDIVFFRGGDLRPVSINPYNLVSSGIMMAQKMTLGDGSFSHVGILVSSAVLPGLNLEPDVFYILESTVSSAGSGVQIRRFDDVVSEYLSFYKDKTDRIAIGYVVDNPFLKNPARTKRAMRQVIDSYIDSRYEYNCFNILGSVIPCIRPARRRMRRLVCRIASSSVPVLSTLAENERDAQFCSELVARCFMKAGRLRIADAEDAAPVDFLDGGRFALVDRLDYV